MQIKSQSKTILLLTILTLVAICQLPYVRGNGKSKEEKVPKVFNYGTYVEKFKKAYSELETLNKAKLFYGRTLKIFHHNVRYHNKKTAYYLGQNQFTDMTANELKKLRYNQDVEMRPVEEARDNPDMPASSSIAVTRILQGNEGYSYASLNDLASAQPLPKTKPIVDFITDDDSKDMVQDVKRVLEKIKNTPELIENIEKVIESAKDEDNQLKAKEMLEIENATKENKIALKPIPKSNNKHYDLETMLSYGASKPDHEEFFKNYAKFLMEGDDFSGLNLTPYDTPSLPEGSDSNWNNDNDAISSPLSALIGSMKSIYDFFTLDGYDESEDTDVAPSGEEKPKVAKDKGIITYEIDWRKTGCVTKAKNQKDCNSCYAFSTLSLMEYFHCKQTKQLTEFSPQYVVDCGVKHDLHGCQGGKLSNVGQFIRKYGIELDNTYPYTAREGQCSVSENDIEKAGYLRPQITAWQSFPSIAAWYKWLPKSPIIVGISMPLDFFGYAGGIHDGLSCDDKSIHALLLVGSGKQDGKEFWLLKNSYSEDWGENGYFRISRAAPIRCFNSAVVARPKFVQQ